MERINLIAHQCIFEGCDGVSFARSMLSQYTNEEYNDSILCNGNENYSYRIKKELAAKNNNNESTFQVFPNPASQYFVIQSNITNGFVEVYDIAGRIITTQPINNKFTTISIEAMPEGILLVKIKTVDGKYISTPQKVVHIK